MRVLPSGTSGCSVISPVQAISMFAETHHSNQVAVKADVAPVGLESDLPTIEAGHRHIRKTTRRNRAFPDVLQIRFFQPTTLLWKVWLKFKGEIQIALG